MNADYQYALGKALEAKRLEAGLSKQQLSLMVGINRFTIRRIEQGEANPTIATLLRITRGLGVSLADVIVECERILQSATDRPELPSPTQHEIGPMTVSFFLTSL